MSTCDKEERQPGLTCGKCGSKAITCENGHDDSLPQRVIALKCLICGNRQEKGAACRWPFFQEGTESGAGKPGAGDKAENERPENDFESVAAKKPRKSKKRAEEPSREFVGWEHSRAVEA